MRVRCGVAGGSYERGLDREQGGRGPGRPRLGAVSAAGGGVSGQQPDRRDTRMFVVRCDPGARVLREAQGLAIVEALAANRPVIASNVGGIPEMIRSGENGILVPSQDPSALASAIALLFRDRALADRLASVGHDLVHERFCVDDMLRDIEAIYLLAVGGTVNDVPDRTGIRR